MSARRPIVALLIALLLGGYGYRAYTGIRAGWALDRGHLLRNLQDYKGAAPLLESAAVGFNATRALLMAAEARLDQWEKEARRRGSRGADPAQLIAAGRDYLTCRCLAPAARDSWKGLGEVYDALESIERERRAETPWSAPAHPWLRIGRPGRVAVGMLREALELWPNWSALHDRLALTLWTYGVYDEARQAVRAAARVLPIYHRHKFYFLPQMPEWVPREFADSSREVLGQLPLFPRTAHLIELGKLERRMGENGRAIASLEKALQAGGDPGRIAEASFHLGLALIDDQSFDRGRHYMEQAVQHPVFRASSLRSLARVSSLEGDDAKALDYLRQLRWEDPRALAPCLEFAAVAARLENWPAALEALRWAKLNHPDEIDPYRQLVRVHLAMGDSQAASAVALEMESSLWSGTEELAGVRREIARGAGGS